MKKIRIKKRNEGKFPTYKPKVMTEKDMDEGLRELFQKQKSKQSTYPHQRPERRQPSLYKQPEPEPEPEEEDEYAYWSPEEWEEWALALYKTYPDIRKYLPEWFLEAVEE